MPLQKKSFLFLLVSLLVSIVILFGTTSAILFRSYKLLEEETAWQEIQRVEKAYQGLTDRLISTTIDWAYWDDTYLIIGGQKPDYIESNLTDDAIANIKVNLIQFVDNQGRIVYQKALFFEEYNLVPPEQSQNLLVDSYPYLYLTSPELPQQAGLVQYESQLMLVVSSMVLPSDLSGHPIGNIVMGRFIGQDVVENLSDLSGMQVDIIPLSSQEISADLADLAWRMEIDGGYQYQTISKDEKAAFSLLKDINGEPVALIRVIIPRVIFSQGLKTLSTLFSVLLVLVLIVLAVFYRLLDKFFFKRILDLNQDVRVINEIGKPDARIMNIQGNDEISTLGRNINHLLETLDDTQQTYKTLIENQGEGLGVVDTEENFIFANPAADNIFNLPPGTLIGRNLMDFLSEEDQKIVKQQTGVRKKGKKSTYELTLTLDDGKKIPVLITANPKYDKNGKVVATYGIFRDITELKKTQQILKESEVKFRSFIEQSLVGIFLLDEGGRVVEWNKSLEMITGLNRDTARGHHFIDVIEKLLPTENRTRRFSKALSAMHIEMLKTGRSDNSNHPLEFELTDINGKLINVDLLPFPIVTAKGVMVGGVFYDKTDRKRMEKVELEQKKYIKALLDTAEALNSTLDLDTLMDRILENSEKVIPSETGAILLLENGYLKVMRGRGYIERGLADISLNHPMKISGKPNMLWMLETGQPIAIPDTTKYPGWSPIPENLWVRSYLGVPLKVHDRVMGFISLFSDIPNTYTDQDKERLKPFANQAAIALENARLYSETQKKADTDSLTGLKNRRSFFEMGAREIERAIRFEHPLSALMIDLDHFKDVNDTYGHPIGDKLLVELAEVFRTKLRNVDLVARYGGDEFIILLPENNLKAAMEVGGRLRQNLEKAHVITGQGKASVTASIGVAALTEGMTTLSALIEAADRALYNAKKFGKNRVISNTDK